MKRDTTLFAQDLKVDVSGDEIPYDTSHIYTGEIYGKICQFDYGTCLNVVLLYRIVSFWLGPMSSNWEWSS